MFYDIVFFKPANATVRLLPDGTYNVIKPPGMTIQAVDRLALPVDQSAEVVALTTQNATLTNQNAALAAQVVQLQADLAACQNAQAAAPTIANMTVTPSSLPVGGGNVVIAADVTGVGVALTLALDGVPIAGPIVLPATTPV